LSKTISGLKSLHRKIRFQSGHCFSEKSHLVFSSKSRSQSLKSHLHHWRVYSSLESRQISHCFVKSS